MKLKSFSQKDRYGNMTSFEFFEPDLTVPMMMIIPKVDGYNGADSSTHPGEPKGTDTVPAWLTPGENVVNAEASRLPGNQEKIDEMNEQGRMIQKAQGGPIPTYAAGGMEVPRYDGMLNSLGQRLGDRDGGPMYAAVGSKVPSWLTDEVLDSLKMVESSGDPMATSEVGAQGLYQIMPATAQQPGMNVPPLAVEDIRDPVKSREFARNYLTGIASANPDFTPEEVLTAYHSGAGNVRKAKAGTEALGPRGQAYAGKIMDNMSGPDKFGVTRRQVSTVPGTVIGTLGDQKVYSDDLGEFVMTPEGEVYLDDNQAKMVSREVPEIAAVPPTPLGERLATEATTAKPTDLSSIADQAKRFAMYPLEFAGLPVDADAPGVPVPNIFDVLPEDPGMTNVNAAIVKNDTENEARLANLINQKKANNETVTPELVQMHKDAVKKLADSKATQAKELSDRAATKVADEKAVAEAQSYVPEENKAPPKPADSKATALNTLADDLLKNIPDNKKVPAAKAKEIEEKGEKVEPSFMQSIITGFKDIFSDMFTPEEISRMAIMYAGSRALGYDHNASLGYSAKQFVKRYDSAIEQRQKDVRDKDFMELYTKESLDKYLKTGNRDDLIERKTGTTVQGFGDLIEHDTLGTLQTVKVGKDKYAIEYNGQYYSFDSPLMKGQIQKHNPKYDNAQEVEDYFAKRAKDKISNINAAVDQNGKRIDTEGAIEATELSNRYLSDVKTFAKGRPEAKAKLRAEALRAQDDYWNAVKKANATGGKQPNSVLSFYNKRAMVVNTEGAVSANDLKGADIAKVLELNDQVLDFAGKKTRNPDDAAKVYKGFWKRASKQWDAHSKGTKFIGMKPSDDSEHNDYTYWVSQLLADGLQGRQKGDHHAEAMALLNKK